MELEAKKTSLYKRLKQNVLILVPLIVTSFDRVANIANAMDLRGFGKKKVRTYYAEKEETKRDKIMNALIVFLLLSLILVILHRFLSKNSPLVWYPF